MSEKRDVTALKFHMNRDSLFDSAARAYLSFAVAELEKCGLRVCSYDPGGPGDRCHEPDPAGWKPVVGTDAVDVILGGKSLDRWGRPVEA